MSLRETLEQQRPAASAALAAVSPAHHAAIIKSRLHKDILQQVDLRTMENMPPERLRAAMVAALGVVGATPPRIWR